MPLKNLLIIALGTAALLLIPVLGHWPWTASDFIIAGMLIFVTGNIIDLVRRKAGKYKVAAIVTVMFLFAWLWAELAVGVFTNWGS